ncbi:hypothetical protein HN51_040012 [Arachis hypogaea]
MWRVPVSLKRKAAFLVMVTEMVAKAGLEWEADDYTLTLPNKDLYIPHGDWLKNYPSWADGKKKRRKVTIGESNRPVAAASSSLRGPMTQELGLKILEWLERLERCLNRKYENIKLKNRDWDPMIKTLDTPEEHSEEEDAAQGDGIEASPPPEHEADTGAIGVEVSPPAQQPADQPTSSP